MICGKNMVFVLKILKNGQRPHIFHSISTVSHDLSPDMKIAGFTFHIL